MAEMRDGIALQNAEFDALENLTRQWRRIQMTPVVDDDYPEVRHGYEGALASFLSACKANGRTMR
jgi:hypothetical protein